jgi:hypothetical protein
MSDKEKLSVFLKGSVEQYESQESPISDPLAGQGIEERKLMRKIDLHLLPILILLYLLSFIDRANIVSPHLIYSS